MTSPWVIRRYVRGIVRSQWLQRELGPEFSMVVEMEFSFWEPLLGDLIAVDCPGSSIKRNA